MSARLNKILHANTAKATVHGYTSFPALADAYERSLRSLCDDLDTLEGLNATPAKGCFLCWCFLGDASVLVEFEYEPAERETRDEPGHPESVEVLRALINGAWVDAEFPEKVIDVWTQRCVEHMGELRQRAADDEAEARAEARRGA